MGLWKVKCKRLKINTIYIARTLLPNLVYYMTTVYFASEYYYLEIFRDYISFILEAKIVYGRSI